MCNQCEREVDVHHKNFIGENGMKNTCNVHCNDVWMHFLKGILQGGNTLHSGLCNSIQDWCWSLQALRCIVLLVLRIPPIVLMLETRFISNQLYERRRKRKILCLLKCHITSRITLTKQKDLVTVKKKTLLNHLHLYLFQYTPSHLFLHLS